MKALVCGSCGWTNWETIKQELGTLPAGTTIIVGGAKGADTMSIVVANNLRFTLDVHLPKWEIWGKRAGLMRNLEMLDEKPDVVIAFWDGQSPGTKHTIEEARRRGIEVRIVQ